MTGKAEFNIFKLFVKLSPLFRVLSYLREKCWKAETVVSVEVRYKHTLDHPHPSLQQKRKP